MLAHGNSFGLGMSNGQSMAIRDPESAERLGNKLTWGWAGFQSPGNAL